MTDRGATARPRVVFVEPICRGSRLQNLAYLVGALVSSRSLTLVTRPDFRTDHFEELLGKHLDRLEIVPTRVDLGGEWIRRLTAREFLDYVGVVSRTAGSTSESYDLVFTAIDEYLPWFALFSAARKSLGNLCKVFAVRYRVGPLLGGPRTIRRAMIRRAMSRGIRGWNAFPVVFDERLDGASVGSRTVTVLPDPWAGDFSTRHRSKGRHSLRLARDSFVLLAMGRQDQRKGLPLLLDAIPAVLARLPYSVILVVGRIEDRFRGQFEALVREHGPGRIVHVDRFVAEGELPGVYASADVILLPYDAGFDASSGVLARAAATGVPVAASDHGLVGHRVRAYRMGETFRTGDVTGFVEALERIHEHTRTGKAAYAPGQRAFAGSCSLPAFEDRVRRLFGGRAGSTLAAR